MKRVLSNTDEHRSESLRSSASICVRLICFLVLAATALASEKPGPLPQTTLWDFPETIVNDQYRELRDFYERQIRDATPRQEAFSRKIPDDQRKLLRELTGAIDQPMAPKPTRTLLGETADYSASLVSWPLLRMGTEPRA